MMEGYCEVRALDRHHLSRCGLRFEALRVATDSAYATAFGTAGSNALVLLLLDTQHYGT
jgi:hypothetical protein